MASRLLMGTRNTPKDRVARPGMHRHSGIAKFSKRRQTPTPMSDPPVGCSVQHSTQHIRTKSNNKSCSESYLEKLVLARFFIFCSCLQKQATLCPKTLENRTNPENCLEHFVWITSKIKSSAGKQVQKSLRKALQRAQSGNRSAY